MRTKPRCPIRQLAAGMRISGNFKFNLDLSQALQVVASILSIIAAIITIVVLW